MKSVHGDLIALALAGEFDVICQGCNCFCTMGAGIARQIKQVFPEAYAADLKTRSGDKGKLGTFSAAEVVRNNHKITIVNAYTQYDYRGHGIKVDYSAIKHVFMAIKKRFSGKRIGYPKLGAGLAGGDWNIISSVIDEILHDENHALVIFAK